MWVSKRFILWVLVGLVGAVPEMLHFTAEDRKAASMHASTLFFAPHT